MNYIDRSRIDTQGACPFKRHLAYDTPNNSIGGFVPKSSNEHLLFGIGMHHALDLLLQDNSVGAKLVLVDECSKIEGTTPDGHDRSAEYYALGCGLLHAAEHHLIPSILDQFIVIGTEIELSFPLSDTLTYMTRLDAAVRRKRDGMPFVIEWKTTSIPDRLLFSVERRMQMMMEAEALRVHLRNEWVGGVIVIGFDKGRMMAVSHKEETAGLRGKRRISPFTYGYKPTSTGWNDSANLRDCTYAWKAGLTRFPVWTAPSSIEAWLDTLPDDVFRDCIVNGIASPLMYHPEIIERVRAEIVASDSAYRGMSPISRTYANCHQDEGIMNAVCEYDCVCSGGERIDGDLFTARTPNHPLELNER